MVFLDSNAVIYLIEQPPIIGAMITARVTALLASGERLAVSDLVRMECAVGPLKANDAVLLAKYATFFASPEVDVLAVSAAVCDRAASIRAQFGLRPLDSLHLSAAVEYGCTLLLTKDVHFQRFTGMQVEIL